MRGEADRAKIEQFMAALGKRVTGAGRIYLVGGATAVLHGWRATTIDVDLKAEPEPRGLFEAIATLKKDLDLNVELASPDQFIPPLPAWRERSLFIARHGQVDFHHYDFFGQALAKLQRGHPRDRHDVHAMHAAGLIQPPLLWSLFTQIESQLLRYPAIDPATFRATVKTFCHDFLR